MVFKCDKNNEVCLTKCPFRENIEICSLTCQRCENYGGLLSNNEILCFIENDTIEDGTTEND